MNTDKIFSDSLVSTVRLFLEIIRGIIIIPIVTKLLGASTYGQWVIVLSVVGIAIGIGNFHLYGALIRFTPIEQKRGQTLVDTLTLGIIFSIIISIAFYLLSLKFRIFPLPVNNLLMVHTVMVFIVVKIVLSIFKNYPRSLNRVKEYEAVWISQIILEIIGVSMAFWMFKSLVIGIWSLIAVALILNVILALRYIPRARMIPQVSSFSKYLKYSAPMVPKSIATSLLSNADKYLLGVYVSPTAVAVYAVTYSVAVMLQNITAPLNSTLYPSVTKTWETGNVKELQVFYKRIYRGYTVLGIPALVGISILGDPILKLISTSQIANEGKYILPILALGFFVRGFDNPIEYVFNAAMKNKELAFITLLASSFNLVFNLILIPVIGLMGAVIVTLISQCAITLYLVTKIQSFVRILFPVATIGRAIFASLIMGAILLFQPLQFNPLTKLIIFPIVGIISYTIIMVLLGEITIREIISLHDFV